MKFIIKNSILKNNVHINYAFNCKNGFSLIEVMVVVATIGILAAIGVPQYEKFKAKARQTEAKASLATLFSAESSFFTEWSQYTIDLANAGFGVSGTNLRYATGFYSSPCVNYISPPAPPELGSKKWNCTFGTGATFVLPSEWLLIAGRCQIQPLVPPAGTITECISTPGNQRFRAAAVGNPNSEMTAVSVDAWTIDQNKILSNSTPGIR